MGAKRATETYPSLSSQPWMIWRSNHEKSVRKPQCHDEGSRMDEEGIIYEQQRSMGKALLC